MWQPGRRRALVAAVAVGACLLGPCQALWAQGAVFAHSSAEQAEHGLPGQDAVQQAIGRGELPQAETLLRRQLTAKPDDAEAAFLLGYVLFREGHARESLAAYTDGARGKVPTADQLVVVASDYILLKSLPDAEHWLRLAVDKEPGNAYAWYLLGRTQYNEDRADEAIASFERALALTPREVRTEYNLGLAAQRLGDHKRAADAYEAAIRWQQGAPVQDAQPYLDLGVMRLGDAQPAQALPLLQQAARIDPENAYVQQELGLALEATGQPEEAIAPLKRAAALAPASEQPHFFLARIYRRLHRTGEADAEVAAVARLLHAHSSVDTPNADVRP